MKYSILLAILATITGCESEVQEHCRLCDDPVYQSLQEMEEKYEQSSRPQVNEQ